MDVAQKSEAELNYEGLDIVLTDIKQHITQMRFYEAPPKVFMCYAWVTSEEEIDNQDWGKYKMTTVLQKLHGDLLKAGFSPHLDRISNDPQESVTDMIGRIRDADFVVCFLTPVFKAKYCMLEKTLSQEFDLIQERRRARKAQEKKSGVFMYCYGEYDKTVPTPWDKAHQNLLVRGLPNNYLDLLAKILKEILVPMVYQGPSTGWSDKFIQIWNKTKTLQNISTTGQAPAPAVYVNAAVAAAPVAQAPVPVVPLLVAPQQGGSRMIIKGSVKQGATVINTCTINTPAGVLNEARGQDEVVIDGDLEGTGINNLRKY